MSRVDLNALREQIQNNQQRGTARPTEERDKVYANPDGRIVRGTDVSGDREELSEIPQTVFASTEARLVRDAETVARKLPADAQLLTVDGVSGWLYRIESELGDAYDMFVYYDGSQYQVKVVFPDVVGRYDPHYGHLYNDGRICFGSGVGLSDLESAYAKSVLWATGFSVFLRNDTFPFNS